MEMHEPRYRLRMPTLLWYSPIAILAVAILDEGGQFRLPFCFLALGLCLWAGIGEASIPGKARRSIPFFGLAAAFGFALVGGCTISTAMYLYAVFSSFFLAYFMLIVVRL